MANARGRAWRSGEAVIVRCAVIGLAASPSLAAAPPNFEEHVGPILDTWCVDCHRGSRGKNGVALQDHAATMKGGSAGAIVVPGDPGSSILYLVASHERDPVMPPDGDRMSDEELTTLRDWIAGGCRMDAMDEGSGPKVAVMAAMPRPAAGMIVMPGPDVSPQPYWLHDRSDAVIALDASPTSPLLAIGGHRQVTLASIEDGRPLACMPFHEGTVHDLRFSRDGALLVIGGGRDGASGVAAIVDVASGERLRTFGGEPDAVLAADLSPDGSMLALGGPDGVVRVIDVADGSDLHRLTPHTDWVTAVRFSPDGAMLATADRAGGAFVWEAWTGREFHRLPGLGGPATAIAWRGDSNLVGFATDAGPIAVFDMERGDRISNQSLHGGVLAATFQPDGRLLTAGRDGRARIGDVGGGETAGWASIGDLATAVASSADGTMIAVGGLDGIVRLFTVGDAAVRASVRADPPLVEETALAALESSLVLATSRLADAELAAGTANDAASVAEQTASAAKAMLESVRATHAESIRVHATATAALAAIDALLAEPRRRLEHAAAERAAVDKRLLELEAVAEHRAAEMRAAVETLATLETDAVLNGRSPEESTDIGAARRLAEGATALAQRAAADVGDARTALETHRIREETWRAAIDARTPELETARNAEAVARAAVEEAATALAMHEEEAARTAASLASAREAAAGAGDAVAVARATRESAAQAVAEARARLDRLRAGIAADRGRVRGVEG
jgi:hypothetical protein